MKITKNQLKQIIKEELSAILGEENGTQSCEDLLEQLRDAEGEMKEHDPRNFGAMAGGQMPMYDADAAYDEAAGNYDRVKAEMEKQNCPMLENH
jgi:hypothetical protein|tara:strand:+ start:266 stop:547 length:282 start_codon:yes stop_codon:yes gene_type:complete